MNKWKWFVTGLVVALLVGAFLIAFGVIPTQAEDDVIGFCIDSESVNFIGQDVIDLYEDMGYTVVDDGSCYYLQCDEVLFEDGTGTGAWSCDMAQSGNKGNYNAFVKIINPQPELQIVEGCLDPSAENYMNPLFWTGYEITEANWTCIYPEVEVTPAVEVRESF